MTRPRGSIVQLPSSAGREFEIIATATQPHRLSDKRTVSVPAGCDYVVRYLPRADDRPDLPYICVKEVEGTLVECFGKGAIIEEPGASAGA